MLRPNFVTRRGADSFGVRTSRGRKSVIAWETAICASSGRHSFHAKAQISAINRLRSELNALKIELESVKTKVDSTYFAPHNEHMSLVPLAPTTGQVSQKSGQSLEGESSQPDRANQFRREDTWVRDEPPNDGGERD